MSSDKKIIAVLGSTGSQGGSVVRSIVADGTFAVRAITRNVGGEGAQKLKAAGAEVVAADLEDVESLKKAFKGAHGVFGVTGERFNHMSDMYCTGLTAFCLLDCKGVPFEH